MAHEDFIRLLVQLRARGYTLGVDDVLYATYAVIGNLAELRPDQIAPTLQRLAPVISPVICKTKEEQASFRSDWAEICSFSLPKFEEPEPSEEAAARNEEAEAETRVRKSKRRVAIGAVLLMFALLLVPALFGEQITDLGREVLGLSKVEEERPEPLTEAGTTGVRETADGLRPIPQASVQITRLPSQTETLIDEMPETFKDIPPLPAQGAFVRIAAALDGRMDDIVRYMPVALSLIGLLGILTIFGFRLVVRREQPASWQRRPLRLDALRLDEAIEPMLRSSWYRRAFRDLRGYRQRETNSIDAERSIDRTISQNGLAAFVFDTVPEVIEYMALIERYGTRDHLTRFAESIVDEIQRADIHVETGYFDGSLERVWVPTLGTHPLDLTGLHAQYPNRRLLIFSSSDTILSDLDLSPLPWARGLDLWPGVGLLTSAPAYDWVETDWRLRDQGTPVHSIDSLGLQDLGNALSTGQFTKPLTLLQMPGIPKTFAYNPSIWQSADRPKRGETNRMIDALRTFLGADGFRLLCATALYPILSWEVTLFLASRLLPGWDTESLVIERRVLDICRLPWFRNGIMPAWLRWELMGHLSEDERNMIRRELLCLIEGAQRSEDANAPRIALSEIPEVPPRISTEKIDVFLDAQDPTGGFSDYMFLNTLRGHRPSAYRERQRPWLRTLLDQAVEGRAFIAPVALSACLMLSWVLFAGSLTGWVEQTLRDRRDSVLNHSNSLHELWVLSAGEAASGEKQDYSSRDLTGVSWRPRAYQWLYLDELELTAANLDGARLTNVRLVSAKGIEVKLRGATVEASDLTRVDLQASDLSGSFIEDTILNDARFDRARMTGAVIRQSQAEATQFPFADFRDADLSGSNFSEASFERAFVEGADFSQANLTNASFSNASMQGAILTGADLSGADLAEARGLSQEQLDTACVSPRTRLPVGLIASVLCVDPIVAASSSEDPPTPIVALSPLTPDQLSTPTASSTHADIVASGELSCGVSTGLAGFATPNANGVWQGFDVAICRAVAAAVLGDPRSVKFVPTTSKTRFTALASGEVDLLARNTTWTFSRDVDLRFSFVGVSYYDGQGFMVPKALGVTSARELDGAIVCVQTGTTTELKLANFFRSSNMSYEPLPIETNAEAQSQFLRNACDVYTTDAIDLAATRATLEDPSAYVLLPEIISREPLAPLVRHGDARWATIVRTVLNALIAAEELGVTRENVGTFLQGSDSPELNAMLSAGDALELTPNAMGRAIQAVGNYGEIFEEFIGPETAIGLPRGLNALWRQGGLLFAVPFENRIRLSASDFEVSPTSLDEILTRGRLDCGAFIGRQGFASWSADFIMTGFDADFCRAVSAAIFNDPNRVEFVEIDVMDPVPVDLVAGSVSLGLGATPGGEVLTPILTFFDGTAMMVRRDLGVESGRDLDGANVCVESEPTDQIVLDFHRTSLLVREFFQTHLIGFVPVEVDSPEAAIGSYLSGACDVLVDDASTLAGLRTSFSDFDEHIILPELLSKVPRGPAVGARNERWSDLVWAVATALIEAEQLGVTSGNVDEFAKGTNNPEINRLLGAEGDLGEMLGLQNDWVANVIRAVGNYGEMYDRHLGPDTPLGLNRGLNALWTDGGLLYPMPFR